MWRPRACSILTVESDTKLADRTAALQATSSSDVARAQEPSPSTKSKDRQASRGKAASSSPTPGDTIAKVRQDLGEAQRSRGLIEARLQAVTEELNKLKIQSSLDSKRISELTKEKAALVTGMRDRDEELRGKAKLLEVRRRCGRFHVCLAADGLAGCA